jgi:leucyl/phenylalanyl-tRNA--protein transferase
MFSLATDGSKAALAHLVARLRIGGFRLLDTQFLTTHLARFGAVEISRSSYLDRLHEALPASADWHALQPDFPASAGPDVTLDLSAPLGAPAGAFIDPPVAGAFGPTGATIVQLLSHTS